MILTNSKQLQRRVFCLFGLKSQKRQANKQKTKDALTIEEQEFSLVIQENIYHSMLLFKIK